MQNALLTCCPKIGWNIASLAEFIPIKNSQPIECPSEIDPILLSHALQDHIRGCGLVIVGIGGNEAMIRRSALTLQVVSRSHICAMVTTEDAWPVFAAWKTDIGPVNSSYLASRVSAAVLVGPNDATPEFDGFEAHFPAPPTKRYHIKGFDWSKDARASIAQFLIKACERKSF